MIKCDAGDHVTVKLQSVEFASYFFVIRWITER